LEGGNGKGTVYFVPCFEIQEALGFRPITVEERNNI